MKSHSPAQNKAPGWFHFAEEPRKGGGKARQAGDKFRLENIKVIRPAKMAEVPDHLGVGRFGGLNDGQHTRKVVAPGLSLHQMPADAFTGRAQTLAFDSRI